MNINELRIKMNDFLNQLEKEEMEEKKVYDLKPFCNATKNEIKEYLNLHRKGALNISDYWKVGDKRIEFHRATYVIVDIGENITIMRTDLVGLNSCMSMSTSADIEYLDSDVDSYLTKLCSNILGNTFSDLVKLRHFCGELIGESRQLWIPSASEVFGDEAIIRRRNEEQFEFFKKEENRRLGEHWWTRSGFMSGYGNARFVNCYSDGSQGSVDSDFSRGIVPCFYI